MRASVAVVSGALALSALSVPSAQAVGGGSDLPDSFAAAAAPTGKITGVTVNGGKDVIIGVSAKKFTVKVGASHPRGVDHVVAALWQGRDIDTTDDVIIGIEPDTCAQTRTTATCTYTFEATPKKPSRDKPWLINLANRHAGTWKVAAVGLKDTASEVDSDVVALDENYKTVKVKRAAKLTTNASPEPVRRGATITVKGDLTRADWGTLKYGGFASGAVKLQFKKAGGTWKTVKTVSADSRGKVKTTVKASSDGSYRFTYGGSSTTGGVTSAADRIDVR
ncbi:calcium-binding protein [Streptomyces sp. JNUCC 64]